MKPTQLTELFANIKATFVSFFSILMFVALGVGIFLGIAWVAPALQNAADKAFDEGTFHNVQIQYVYGLTDDDLKRLAKVEGVTDIEVGYQSFQTASIGGDTYTVKLQSVGERIDMLSVVKGELPAEADEIALVAAGAARLGIAVGDTVTFAEDAASDDGAAALGGASGASVDKDGMKYLNGGSYKVTAFVNSPEYLATSNATYGISPSASGTVDAVAWVPASAFDASAFQDGYPVVNVRCDSLQGINSFSSEYAQKSKGVEDGIATLGEGLAKARYDGLHGRAREKVDKARAKLDSVKKQIADGEKQLADGRAELEARTSSAEARLASAYDELMRYESLKRDAAAKLARARALVAKGEAAIAAVDKAKAALGAAVADYRARGNAAKAKYEASAKTEADKAAYDAELDALGAKAQSKLQAYVGKIGQAVPAITHENYFETLDSAAALVRGFEHIEITYRGKTMSVAEARKRLAAAKKRLAAAESEYNQKAAQLEEGWAEYHAGREELDRLVAAGKERIAKGEKKVADAKKQVEGNEPKVRAVEEQLAAMKDYAWTVLGRSGNASAAEINVYGNVTTNLSFSMAMLFVIVGLLVSYSAVGRIVHEQIIQVGTKKALGLRGREITASFLLYAGIAVLAGAAVGTAVGVVAVEGIIARALAGMFTFGAFPPYFEPVSFLAVTSLELVLVLAATWLACRSILKGHAVELLKGESPPESKTRLYERWKTWGKLSPLTQTIVNNCVNDKRRVFSTIVGVAGCTALIVTAITLNNDVLKSYDRHYDDVYGFDVIAYCDPAVSASAAGVEQVFQGEGDGAAQVLRKIYLMNLPDGASSFMRVIVPAAAETFGRVYRVNPVSAGGEADLSQDGAWVAQAYHDHFGAEVGDTIAVDAGDGTVHEVPILGFYEFWLTHYEVVMGRAYYEREFGVQAAPNAVLGSAGVDGGVAALDFSNVDGFDSAVDDKAGQYENFEMFSTVSSAVVLIYLVLAALMAAVVLLNLNVMFIEEKKREIIVLMINGFSVRDAQRYVYNDTIVLTTLGIVCGIVAGCASGAVTVDSIEPSAAQFVKDVDLAAVVAGFAGSAMLAFIMSVIALRRIPRFELTDINKQG